MYSYTQFRSKTKRLGVTRCIHTQTIRYCCGSHVRMHYQLIFVAFPLVGDHCHFQNMDMDYKSGLLFSGEKDNGDGFLCLQEGSMGNKGDTSTPIDVCMPIPWYFRPEKRWSCKIPDLLNHSFCNKS